jgi:hypothetical protein
MVQRRVILFRSYGVCAGPDTQEDYRDSNGEFMYMQCLEYVLGQAHRRITEIQTGAHVYTILHYLGGLFS